MLDFLETLGLLEPSGCVCTNYWVREWRQTWLYVCRGGGRWLWKVSLFKSQNTFTTSLFLFKIFFRAVLGSPWDWEEDTEISNISLPSYIYSLPRYQHAFIITSISLNKTLFSVCIYFLFQILYSIVHCFDFLESSWDF